MSMPYLCPLSDTSVRMTDPSHDGTSNSRLHLRISTVAPSSIYKFSHVFMPETQQAEFFTKTTLPLVRDLLEGQNGLLFAYGVTNSGKTYTIQGGHDPDSAGILPRTLDVVFNSVEGQLSDGRVSGNQYTGPNYLPLKLLLSLDLSGCTASKKLTLQSPCPTLMYQPMSHNSQRSLRSTSQTQMILILIQPSLSSTATTSTLSGCLTQKYTMRRFTIFLLK